VGCSTARNKGTCKNRLNIRRDGLEKRVLNGLKGHLMDPELFAIFCEEFTRRRTNDGWKLALLSMRRMRKSPESSEI
jgi:hypothetical protein